MCEGFDFNDAIAAKQTTAFFTSLANVQLLTALEKLRTRIGNDRRGSLGVVVGRVYVSHRGAK